MQTAGWALVVSLFSFAVSLAGFVWAVWSKWVYPKARVRVSCAVMNLITDDDLSKFVGVYATNFGPSDTTLKLLVTRQRPPGWAWRLKVGRSRRWKDGWLMSTNDVDLAISGEGHGLASGMPHKLAVGAEFGTYLPFKHRHLYKGEIVDVGLVDVFGRTHWAPRKSVRKVIETVRKEWPEGPGE